MTEKTFGKGVVQSGWWSSVKNHTKIGVGDMGWQIYRLLGVLGHRINPVIIGRKIDIVPGRQKLTKLTMFHFPIQMRLMIARNILYYIGVKNGLVTWVFFVDELQVHAANLFRFMMMKQIQRDDRYCNAQ